MSSWGEIQKLAADLQRIQFSDSAKKYFLLLIYSIFKAFWRKLHRGSEQINQ